MSEIILINQLTPIQFIESLFFNNTVGKRKKNLKLNGIPIIIDETYQKEFDDILENLRRKRLLENGKRCYEKNKASRLERERERYKVKTENVVKKKPGRPRLQLMNEEVIETKSFSF